MKEINFQEVGMENFGPYISPMIHTFKNNTMTLMVGPNGIGKTMSLDAIPFTLYSTTTKGAKGDDVVNNIVGKNCMTWVKFTIDDIPYKVTRYQKYKKLGNTVILNVNGVDTKSGHREVVPEIERLICPQKSFMNTLMFSQKVKDFFTDLVDSDKKEIFRKILALEQYLLYHKETSNRIKIIKDKATDLETEKKVKRGLLENAIEQITYLKRLEEKFYKDKQDKIDTLQKSLSENERLIENWEKVLQSLQEQEFNIEEVVENLNKVSNKIESLTSKYQLLSNDLETTATKKKYELQESANFSEKRITEDSVKKCQDLDEHIQKYKDQLNTALQEYQEEKHILESKELKLQLEIDNCQSRIHEIKKNVLEQQISTCPECEQDINDETREKLLGKIHTLENTVEVNTKEIETLTFERKKMSKEISELGDNIHNEIENFNRKKSIVKSEENLQKQKNLDKLQEIFSQVDIISSNKRKELEQQSAAEKEELLNTKKKLESLQEKVKSHNEEMNAAQNAISSLSNSINIIKINIDDETKKEFESDQLLRYQQREIDLKRIIKGIDVDLKNTAKHLTILEFWKTGFSSSGIPSMLIDEAIPFMNRKISEYLDMLTNGRYIVSFDTLAETKAGEFRDKISVNVLDTHTQANTRVQLSGGQTRIIDIATILTLGDLQSNIQDIKINLLLFDEIFDSLDDENIGYVAKVLNKIKVGKSIYLISHQHQDQVEADQTLTFT